MVLGGIKLTQLGRGGRENERKKPHTYANIKVQILEIC